MVVNEFKGRGTVAENAKRLACVPNNLVLLGKHSFATNAPKPPGFWKRTQTPDGQTMYVLDEKRDDVNQPRNPHVSQWDTSTGRLLSETRIQVPDHLDGAEYQMTRDGTALLVRGRTPGESGPRVFHVFEAASGQKRCGPIKGAQAELGEVVENSFQKYWNQCAEWLGANKLVVSAAN